MTISPFRLLFIVFLAKLFFISPAISQEEILAALRNIGSSFSYSSNFDAFLKEVFRYHDQKHPLIRKFYHLYFSEPGSLGSIQRTQAELTDDAKDIIAEYWNIFRRDLIPNEGLKLDHFEVVPFSCPYLKEGGTCVWMPKTFYYSIYNMSERHEQGLETALREREMREKSRSLSPSSPRKVERASSSSNTYPPWILRFQKKIIGIIKNVGDNTLLALENIKGANGEYLLIKGGVYQITEDFPLFIHVQDRQNLEMVTKEPKFKESNRLIFDLEDYIDYLESVDPSKTFQVRPLGFLRKYEFDRDGLFDITERIAFINNLHVARERYLAASDYLNSEKGPDFSPGELEEFLKKTQVIAERFAERVECKGGMISLVL